MNELINLLEKHEDKYFYGEEKELAPFVSGEFLKKFKETIFAGDTHCKYNFNGKCYSEFTIKHCTNHNFIEFIDIQINKKGNKYDKVKFWFKDRCLSVNDVKKIFVGHVELKPLEKEKFYSMIKKSEILVSDDAYYEEDFEEVIDEYRNTDKIEEIYKDYEEAIDEYNKANSERIVVKHKFGEENHFIFDLYGNLKRISVREDYGYLTCVDIEIKDIEIKTEEQAEVELDKLAPASEKSINEKF